MTRLCTSALSILVGLMALLFGHETYAQTFGNALATSPTISPASGSKVVAGQTVTVQRVFFGSADPGNSLFRNGEGFLAYPNGSVARVVTNLNLDPPGFSAFSSAINCYGTNVTLASAQGTICVAFTNTYIVNSADVGRTLKIVLPARGQLLTPQTNTLAGIAGAIQFYSDGDTDGFNPNDGTTPTGVASGQGSQFLQVVNPGLTVTKICDTNCFAYGAPITFHGTVCNTGDVALANVVISNTLAGSATVLVTNVGTLAAGQCVDYVGVELPNGNLCGPFTNTVVASGVATSVFQTPTFTASTMAVCFVCPNPCISVTKTCTPSVVGQPQTITGMVTNCGDITLTNISVVDSVVGLITNITSLAPSNAVIYSKTVTAVCGGNTNVVTASGTSLCGALVTAKVTNTCVVGESPCIGVTKNCTTAVIGQPQTISGIVTNCGNVTLTNITVSDNVIGGITNIAILAPSNSVFYSKTVTAPCAPNTNVVTASGTSPCGTFVTAHATNTCLVTENPQIGVTKNCITNSLFNVGDPVTFSGIVTNMGDVPLTNVVVFDTFLNKTILTVPSLAVGGVVSYSTNYTTTANDACHTITNTVIATGATCDGHSVTNAASCTFYFCTPPNIGVTKQVACFLGVPPQPSSLISHESLGAGEICGTFSNSAVGISGTSNTAAFCYTITITNPGPVDLTNVTVIDTNAAAHIGFGDLTTNFPCIINGYLPVGASCSYTFKAEVPDDLTNIVNVSGQSAVTGQSVSTNASAVVTIFPAEIECHKYVSVDGGPLVNATNLPDANPHTVVWYVSINNPSTNVNLMNVTIDDTSTNFGCAVVLAPFELDAGMTNTVAICTNTLQCTNGFTGMINTVVASADTYTLGTNHIPVCAIDASGSNVVVTTANQDCSATITCPHEQGCRVTGGGRQDAPLYFPANVRYITHGGQVGAPVGNHICVVTADFALGNPCIHGRWEHVRHMQGGNMGNFHASLYDTLMCACLDTNLTPTQFMPALVGTNAQQSYVNKVYGPGTTTDGLCNPNDNASGPQPRPAPSNKIAFTGIGDYAETQGRRAPQSVLFRVDVEDRSEPGGSHPKGGKAPPDRNRTRIWILTQSEVAQLHGAGPDPYLLNFRNAISACNGINVQDGASVPNGAPAFGVRAPDIDDGGELSRGNYQLHPSIQACP